MEQIINNKYEILEQIGSGGTSVVYKARCMDDDCLVAIKVLKDEFGDNEKQIERFLRESLALSNLSHLNIVNILDVGKMQNGKDFIAMEYVDGMTLKEYIMRKRRLNFDETVEAAVQICDGLEHAHESGIIHRDIKPQNILLDNEGILKVADFGIARISDQNTLTMAGKDVVGSVHYISPEQARGGVIDARSDIYSLGITIFEMATGRLPFVGDDAITIAMKHINQSPKRPRDLNPDMPQCLNDIILKCISKDPLKRYQTVAELKEDLLSAQLEPETFMIRVPKIAVPASAEGGQNMSAPKGGRPAKRDNPHQKKLFTQKLVVMIVAIVLVLGGLTAAFILLFSPDSGGVTSGSVTVEGFVGKTYAEAVEWAQKVGLRTPQEPTYIYNDEIPAGQIMGQNPESGTVVDKHSSILFEVSGGPEKAKVPLLSNMSEEDAIAAIVAAGLKPGEVHYENTEAYSALRVFKQSIEAETEVFRDTQIDIWIAKSELLKKRVPNLIGKSESAAKAEIENKNFSFGGKYTEYSDQYAAGMVIRQEPASGIEFEYDADVSVKIYISKGPATLYYGTVEIELPEITVPTDVLITHLDDYGQEITVYEQTVDIGTFEPGEKLTYSQNSYTTDVKIYYLYINNERVGEFKMLFYDKDGNLVSKSESTDTGGGSP